jgi:hypothetical protein
VEVQFLIKPRTAISLKKVQEVQFFERRIAAWNLQRQGAERQRRKAESEVQLRQKKGSSIILNFLN